MYIKFMFRVMTTVPLVDVLCKEFRCKQNELSFYLRDPMLYCKVNLFMLGLNMRANYDNNYGLYKRVSFSRFTFMSANKQFAYKGYLGITVRYYISKIVCTVTYIV
jgi:hypothetical protein